MDVNLKIPVKFKKLHPNAVIPKYAKPGDAGLDLTAIDLKYIRSERDSSILSIEYDTGLATEIPNGFVGFLVPRSSVYKKAMTLSNCVGVIDSGYRGPIKAIFHVRRDLLAIEGDSAPLSFQKEFYDISERIVQLIIMPYPTIEPVEVTELSSTERGEGGYGSTGI